VRAITVQAENEGTPVVILGDLNDVEDIELDTSNGKGRTREGSIIRTLQSLGYQSMFRERHPTLRGYTYIGRTSASRIDGGWVYNPISAGFRIQTLNAAIIHKHHMAIDHEICVFDIRLMAPRALAKPDGSPTIKRPWRTIKEIM